MIKNKNHAKPADIESYDGLIAVRAFTEDPYMSSTAYIGMTGRKGLFVYEGQFETIFYSPHPNKYGGCIIFPPHNPNALNDIKNLINKIRASYKTIELIRVPDELGVTWANILKGRLRSEDVLDYMYPVHTIDNKALVSLKGSKFYNFKKTLNKLDFTSIKSQPINFTDDKEDLIFILRRWLRLVGLQYTSNPIEPALYVIEQLSSKINLSGFTVYEDNQPVGFTIWENPKNKGNTANAIIHCALHIQGLSEYIHFQMAKILLEQGIGQLCIGGAESQGLDAFKRKMNPIKSTILKTIDV
tara:strand:+ start:634 stop:1533 length:900 start_codon:yes stop_codon:yes gene_type:complete